MRAERLSLPKSRFAFIGWLGAAMLILGGALAFRFFVIEPHAVGILCSHDPTPWWCASRDVAIAISNANGWGLTALAAGAIALLSGFRPAAIIAFGFGLWGLVLYNAGPAGFGFVLGLLKLLRHLPGNHAERGAAEAKARAKREEP